MSEIKKHYFQFPHDYQSMSDKDKEIALTKLADEILDQVISPIKENK